MESQLPIIYVRGYAGNQSAVEQTVDLPYYGFNLGSTKVRTGPGGDPELYIFESPLVRLMREPYGYSDYFVRVEEGGRVVLLKSSLREEYPRRSLWIYRYYDVTSKQVGAGRREEIEALAGDLAKVVDFVLERTKAPRVNLVAHSMGGLICRSLIQRTWRGRAREKIDKLFTYATPHNGIHFRPGLGWLANVRDLFGINDADTFGPKRMRGYLGFPKKWAEDRLNDLHGQFPAERVFSLIGTNHHDYGVALGLSRTTVGPGSDGLVMQKCAYVKGSNRAYVYRSHSGAYGIVNSEEGFQNLQRFLFGETSVQLILEKVKVRAGLANRNDLRYLMLETDVVIRGEMAYMTQQREEHGSALAIEPRRLETGEETLYRTFLLKSQRQVPGRYSHFQVRIRLVPVFVRNRLILRDTFYPGQSLFDGSLVIAVSDADPEGVRMVKAGWGTMDDDLPSRGARLELDRDFVMPLPVEGSELKSGTLKFRVRHWNAPTLNPPVPAGRD